MALRERGLPLMPDHDDCWDGPAPSDPVWNHSYAGDSDFDGDERAEANAQYSWGLEIQQEVAALTGRSRR